MSSEVEDFPQPLAIEHFASDARSLSADAFRSRYGDAFLVRRGPLDSARRPKIPQRTMVLESASVNVSPPSRRGPSPGADLVVIPVKHTGRSPYPSMITVGRTKNNDVVLPDVVVSKFHAFFKDDGGKLLLQDAESRNGTFVAGRPVPSNKAGKPVEVQPGTKIKFGLIDFWFLDAAGLADLAVRSTEKA